MIARIRISRWDGGTLLDPAHMPHLATLTELDLSGLRIGDNGLAAFAATAHFPALSKLILGTNDITNAGTPRWLRRQDCRALTRFISLKTRSPTALTPCAPGANFRLAHLDLGERPEGYCMSPGEVEIARRQYLRENLLPVVSQYFQTYDLLQSAMLCVAQVLGRRGRRRCACPVDCERIVRSQPWTAWEETKMVPMSIPMCPIHKLKARRRRLRSLPLGHQRQVGRQQRRHSFVGRLCLRRWEPRIWQLQRSLFACRDVLSPRRLRHLADASSAPRRRSTRMVRNNLAQNG